MRFLRALARSLSVRTAEHAIRARAQRARCVCGLFEIEGKADNLLFASSQYLLDMIIRQEGGDQPDPSELCLPSEIVALVNAFPFGVKKTRLTKAIFAPYIPTRERTLQLTDLYFKHLGWL